jgi:CheY-like chemotaxis protein
MNQETQETLKILIIDVCSQTRQLIRERLLHRNLEILEASDGEIGLEICKKISPHLIVSEIHLLGMNGYQIARTIRDKLKLKRQPFLIAFTPEDNGCNGYYWSIKQGFNVHVSKRSEGLDKLISVVNDALDEICTEIIEQK